jgi:formamidopyrimidine-DNA glycosylase
VPELPEVETIAREVHSLVAGATIADVKVRKADVLREATAASFRRKLIGTRIERAWRRAKYVVIDLSSGLRICVQPRFTGALMLDTSARPLPAGEQRYSTLHLDLEDGRRLHYVDVRRLGTVALMTPERFRRHHASLGVEPLAPEFTPAIFAELLRASGQAIKKVIMDQTKVAGVGNIYANEALWRAGIDPSKPARKVSRSSADALHREIIAVLSEAVDSRGTSFRDYRDASGNAGDFFFHLNAYGRATLPCPRCGRKMIGTHAIDGRATVFCAHCQR